MLSPPAPSRAALPALPLSVPPLSRHPTGVDPTSLSLSVTDAAQQRRMEVATARRAHVRGLPATLDTPMDHRMCRGYVLRMRVVDYYSSRLVLSLSFTIPEISPAPSFISTNASLAASLAVVRSPYACLKYVPQAALPTSPQHHSVGHVHTIFERRRGFLASAHATRPTVNGAHGAWFVRLSLFDGRR